MAKVRSPKRSMRRAPPREGQTIDSVEQVPSSALTPLNFKVPQEFHREFKSYAAQQGIAMVDLLQEGFRLVKAQRG